MKTTAEPTREILRIKRMVEDDPNVVVFCNPSFYLSTLKLLDCSPDRVISDPLFRPDTIGALKTKDDFFGRKARAMARMPKP